MALDKSQSVTAESANAWRQWLDEHHAQQEGIWLIIYKKDSGTPSVTYDEAVDEALCVGWVDSLPNKRDEESYYQYFAPRKPKSNWSRVNKEKVARMLQAGKMSQGGLAAIEVAKANGAWTALDAVENLEVPTDLAVALTEVPNAQRHWDAFPRSVKRGILEWIMNAKRADTRQKRVDETARLAGENIRANQWRQPKKK
ncbi:MAG TPA: hypothetical protein DCE41_10675 [Cytophagales bacterium]|nr:hypothetical protein [Cytophagales bacterium]HAA19051.1 hypothetical protein [Cytophagales bacterium]HAP59328.1 hypothetical protein [Cytophagales bacterium]